MSDGPMACQAGAAARTAALALRPVTRRRRRGAVSAVAALAIAAARDLAAGAVRNARPVAAVPTFFARNALFVSPNFGRAAFRGAIVATTSSLIAGSRSLK